MTGDPVRGRVLWVSTGTSTRGGVAAYVTTMRQTPLWSLWSIRHVATHEDGSAVRRVVRFVRGAVVVAGRLVVRRPDLLHLHSASRGSFARKATLARLARVRGVPVVFHVHGGGFADFHDAAPAVVRRVVRHTLEAADAVVALGPGWAAQLTRIAPAARVVVVPNAVAPRAAPAPPDPARPVGVLFLGRVGADKGTTVLVEAWARVAADLPQPGARLVVAGDGDCDGLRRQVRDLGVADSVTVAGWVPGDRVSELLATSQLLVLPSRWEGQPMAVLEAMAHGLAVVATDVGGLPDLVDECSGLLVPPDDVDALADALGAVLSDPERRARLGAGGLRRAREDFDVAVVWRRLDDLYREVCR